MAHETILPAIRALLLADGAAEPEAEAACAMIARAEGAWVPVANAARTLGIARRTAWLWIRNHGVPTRARTGRCGSLVRFADLEAAAHARRTGT